MPGLTLRLIIAVAGTTIGVAAIAAGAIMVLQVFAEPAAEPPTLLTEIFAISCFAAVILIAVSWDVLHVIRESVTHPLQHLIIAVRRMGDGNYSVPLETLDRSALSGLTNEMEMARRKTSAQIEELKSKNAELTVDITERIESSAAPPWTSLRPTKLRIAFLAWRRTICATQSTPFA